jgi:hypothetical protein
MWIASCDLLANICLYVGPMTESQSKKWISIFMTSSNRELSTGSIAWRVLSILIAHGDKGTYFNFITQICLVSQNSGGRKSYLQMINSAFKERVKNNVTLYTKLLLPIFFNASDDSIHVS